MADAAVEKVGNEIAGFTLLQTAELITWLEDKLGVKAAAPVAAVAAVPAGGGAAAPAAEEPTEFTVILKSGGDKKLNVIKEVRTIVSGLGIKEAKELVEAGGKVIKEGVTKEEAAKIKKQLEDQGAIVEIK
jgi:large subunit ribosomal protein L7/L12